MPASTVDPGINWGAIMTIVVIVLLVVLVIAIIGKLFKIALAIGAVIILFPILTTILWGDGATYVEKFASLFNPEIGSKIEQGYEYYREKDSEDPIVDLDKVNDTATDIFDSAKDIGTDIFTGIKDAISTPPPQTAPPE